MEANASMARRISPFFLAVIMITLILSLVMIFMGMDDFTKENSEGTGYYFLIMGVSVLAISTYLLFQTRRRVLKLGMVIQPLNTTLECQKCGFKNVREFQRGDYVFKPTEDQCPKCNEKTMTIGSIFREVKEKEKT